MSIDPTRNAVYSVDPDIAQGVTEPRARVLGHYGYRVPLLRRSSLLTNIIGEVVFTGVTTLSTNTAYSYLNGRMIEPLNPSALSADANRTHELGGVTIGGVPTTRGMDLRDAGAVVSPPTYTNRFSASNSHDLATSYSLRFTPTTPTTPFISSSVIMVYASWDNTVGGYIQAFFRAAPFHAEIDGSSPSRYVFNLHTFYARLPHKLTPPYTVANELTALTDHTIDGPVPNFLAIGHGGTATITFYNYPDP